MRDSRCPTSGQDRVRVAETQLDRRDGSAGGFDSPIGLELRNQFAKLRRGRRQGEAREQARVPFCAGKCGRTVLARYAVLRPPHRLGHQMRYTRRCFRAVHSARRSLRLTTEKTPS